MMSRAAILGLAALWAAGVSAACTTDSAPVDIYPTATELPENLLRMYVYFPKPMAADGLAHVRLLDAQDVPVNGVFLASREDLWSPDRRRLTLLLDPGRVKTGLVAHDTMGRALVPGQTYTLEISGATMDAEGCPFGQDIRHAFTVTEADLSTPNPAEWSVSTPKADSSDPVIVDLGTTHDHLSMAYRLRVVDRHAKLVPGSIALGPDEASWLFTPRTPWEAATYDLLIDERLEDLAGNRPGALFDRTVTAAAINWVNRLSFTPD